jgi:hypothetical protein
MKEKVTLAEKEPIKPAKFPIDNVTLTPPPISKTLRGRLFATAILLVYAALILWLTVHHEPWRDEADAWLMVRDNSFEGLFRIMGYAGTPMLWYLSIWPLVKAGMPYASMNILNACFGIATAAIVLFCAPFGLQIRALILFGYLFSYEYPVIARSYQLSIFLIFSLAALHSRRFDRPMLFSSILALLANTNVNGLIIAISIGAVHFASLILRKSEPRYIVKFVIPISLGVILSVVQLLPPSDGQFSSAIQFNWETAVVALKESFVPSVAANFNHGIKAEFGGLPVFDWPLIPSLLCVAAILFQIRKSRWALCSFGICWLGLFSLIIFKYPGFIRHWGFLFVTAIYALWVGVQESKQSATQEPQPEQLSRQKTSQKVANAVISLVLLSSVATAVQVWLSDTKTSSLTDLLSLNSSKKKSGLATDRGIPKLRRGISTSIPARKEGLLSGKLEVWNAHAVEQGVFTLS